MWYDDIADPKEYEDDAKLDEYYRKLEAFWYQIRPHTTEKDFEELNVDETEDLKKQYKTHLELEEEYYNPERFYMTGGR